MKFLFLLLLNLSLLNATNSGTSTEETNIFVLILAFFLLGSLIYGTIRLFIDYGKFALIIPLILLIYRGYVNYIDGGQLIPTSFFNFGEWFFNNFSLGELIIWVILIIISLSVAWGKKCQFCNSSRIRKIDSELIDSEIKREEEFIYNIKKYHLTYICTHCGKESQFIDKVKDKI